MKNHSLDVTRRSFIQTTAAGAAALSAGVWTGGAVAESKSALQKLNIACIGTANRAAANVAEMKGENVVALVDVDKDYLTRKLTEFPQARTYADYREMLDAEKGKLDAVVIGTTDHHHAPAAVRAIRAGLHVYCEKPLTHTIEEARLLSEEAKKHGVATQLGTQIHAGDNYRRVVELIQAGTIGDVSEVHVWVGKGWSADDRPEGSETPPDTLAWDLWLGPAPERPYVAGRYHPANWRRWWDFGGGTLADMGCHYMDLPFWALDLRYPDTCVAEGPEVNKDGCPAGLKVHYEFPAKDSRPAVKLTWYDGSLTPKEVTGERVPGSGVMFVGTEGRKLYANYGSYRLFPQEKFTGFKAPEPTIPNSIGHHAEWIKACKEGTPTTCNFDYSGALTEAVLLGTVAFRTGKKLEWDAANIQASNAPEAGQFIRKEYRNGWGIA